MCEIVIGYSWMEIYLSSNVIFFGPLVGVQIWSIIGLFLINVGSNRAASFIISSRHLHQ